ncbi:solute carrier family 23 member 2-like, partial [Saccoglossus kowalevskii]|uniref:Solute carrier family 23 member 2-like n=1 Tax=Saccoglossus kowalevskii TaxID=10224 RepID=A0ABM0M686_SACKO
MTDTKSFECDMDNVDNDVVAVTITSLPHQPIVEKHNDKYKMDLKYAIDDIPPWYECIAFAVQQLLSMVSSSLLFPSIIVGLFCVEDGMKDDVFAKLFSAVVFSDSVATFLQVTFGSRLPIVQGISIVYYFSAVVTMKLPEWECVQETFVNGSTNMTNISATVTWEDRARE